MSMICIKNSCLPMVRGSRLDKEMYKTVEEVRQTIQKLMQEESVLHQTEYHTTIQVGNRKFHLGRSECYDTKKTIGWCVTQVSV